MNDLRRDWRKWTRTERFSAVIILAALLAVLAPAAIEFNLHSAAASQHSTLN
jgi:hypothetical protein